MSSPWLALRPTQKVLSNFEEPWLEGDFPPGGAHSPHPFPFRAQAPGFVAYLRDERGLRPATVLHYAHWLRRFKAHLDQSTAPPLPELERPGIEAFVQAASVGLSRPSGTGLGGTLRVFLRYCAREGILPTDLSAAVELPQRYRLADTPRAMAWDEARCLPEAVDQHSAIGRRDDAILLLLITYGLRAREVTALMLNDLAWSAQRLRVPGRKAGHSTAYPLANRVAEALIAYLHTDRLPTADRQVFLLQLAPRRPLGSVAVAHRVGPYLRQAGVAVPRGGPHTLRHLGVQLLLLAEFPLESIGQYLGHASPRATAVSAKVSLAALREVARGAGEELGARSPPTRPWPHPSAARLPDTAGRELPGGEFPAAFADSLGRQAQPGGGTLIPAAAAQQRKQAAEEVPLFFVGQAGE